MRETFPHLNIGVYENVPTTAVTTEAKPLHIPVCFLFTEKGDEFTPIGGDGGTLTYLLGSSTFDNTSAYYNHASVFCETAMSSNKVYVIRVVPDDAEAANLVLQATFTQTSLTQYQKDASGALILDANGKAQAKTDSSGSAIQETGYVVSWSTRALTSAEDYDGLTPTVTGTASNPTSITYPILGFEAKYRGAAANRAGFRFWHPSDVDSATEGRVAAALYRFQPIVLAADNSGNVSYVADKYTQNYNDVTLATRSVDPNTAQDLALQGILSNNFPKTGQGSLDYNVKVYTSNIAAAGALLQKVAPSEFPSTLSAYEINIVSGTDESGNPYDHLTVDEASAELLNSTNTIYLTGGADGDVSLTNFESLISTYLQGSNNVEFQDQFRYPFTHFYDSGFTLSTKFNLMQMLGLRDGLYLQMTTFDATATKAYTQAQDQSVGAVLLARLRTYPESTDYGTATCRASIDAQCGPLAVSSGYTDSNVAPTIDVLTKNCLYYSGTYVKGVPKGRPNNEVSVLSDVSWTSATASLKQLLWDTSLNVITYADEDTLFYPDRRTVFTDDKELLSSETFVHFIVFTKKIVRNIWTYYVGREESVSELSDSISNDIDAEINRVFKSRLTSKTTVSQTDMDKLNGFSYTVTVALVGNMPNRVWNVIIPVTRSTDVVTTTTS